MGSEMCIRDRIIDSIKENGGQINGDTEGLAILNHPEGKLLIASSQGSSDFTVYNLSNKNNPRSFLFDKTGPIKYLSSNDKSIFAEKIFLSSGIEK